jgi:hypothetical protein
MRTHSCKHQHRAHTQPIIFLPASYRNPATRHNRCSAVARASGYAGAEWSATSTQSTRVRAQAAASGADNGQHLPPGIIAEARASRHQSRPSAQARASDRAGSERAKPHSRSTREPPSNLAASRQEGGGAAASRGGGPWFARECSNQQEGKLTFHQLLFWHRPLSGLRPLSRRWGSAHLVGDGAPPTKWAEGGRPPGGRFGQTTNIFFLPLTKRVTHDRHLPMRPCRLPSSKWQSALRRCHRRSRAPHTPA